MALNLNEQELLEVEAALVKRHNSILQDRRRKLRASERVMWSLKIKGIIGKVSAEMERLRAESVK